MPSAFWKVNKYTELKEIDFIKRKGFLQGKADSYKGINPSALQSYSYSTTSTARRYLVPTAFGAPGRRISTVVTVVVVIVVTAEGAAAAFGPEVAPAVVAAAAPFLTVLLGGPEEPEGLFAHRLIVAGGGADLLFRGRIGSIPGEAVVASTHRLLLE